MALILPTADQTFTDDSSRRRSTFYVPLSNEDLTSRDCDDEYSYDWSINDSIESSEILREKSSQLSVDDCNRLKRYGIVLNGSVNIDDSNLEVHANHKRSKTKNIASSTPIKEMIEHQEIVKEKSKTLPVKESQPTVYPLRNSHLLKSTPKISSPSLSDTSARHIVATPKKSLSFIRRTHSTKLSRNNSLLKSLTTKCVEHSNENLPVNVYDLSVERLELYLKAENCDDLMKELFLREPLNTSSSDNGSDKDKENNNNNYDDDALSGKRFTFDEI
jgi:hypothetical protein